MRRGRRKGGSEGREGSEEEEREGRSEEGVREGRKEKRKTHLVFPCRLVIILVTSPQEPSSWGGEGRGGEGRGGEGRGDII